ncbi:MAG: SRPBCC family protein [Bryobacteraceae bacterium]
MIRRGLVGLVVLAALGGGTIWLLKTGVYGLTVFVILPVLLGALASWVARPASSGLAAGYGAMTVMVALFCLLFLSVEGFVCVVMCLPLALPLGALGGWLMYRLTSAGVTTAGGLAMLFLIPAGAGWDVTARPDLFEVTTAMEISAPPERVWQYVVSFPELPPPEEWLFRAGVAYPVRTRIEGTGAGATRYCELSTGALVEPIEVWDEPRLLRFRVTETPASMREWSPYGEIAPKHLHGYLVSRFGQFRLTPMASGGTLLEGTTWYQHGLWPATYWRWWSDAIVHQIHGRVLRHVKALAEEGGLH